MYDCQGELTDVDRNAELKGKNSNHREATPGLLVKKEQVHDALTLSWIRHEKMAGAEETSLYACVYNSWVSVPPPNKNDQWLAESATIKNTNE